MAQTHSGVSLAPDNRREAVLHLLSAATFLTNFQSYLVAPLIPALSVEFHSSTAFLGMLVPAFMLPYGTSALFYGPLSYRVGRKPIILSLLGMMALTIAGVATAHTATQMLLWRVLGGITTAGIVPISLALVGDLFSYEERGRPLGWIFAAGAGGMAFGSTLGALLNPLIGWRNEFRMTGALAAVALVYALRLRRHFEGNRASHPINARAMISGYILLFANPRAAKAYTYILLNAVFQSGVFSWLGVFFYERYHLGDRGIGLAFLGYGVPGMLFGPAIGRAADRVGRKRIIPLGILIGALSAAAYITQPTRVWLPVITAFLSLGYHMSHPLLAGIITSVNPARRGLSMGMNAFVLYAGLGLGALLFRVALRHGFDIAFAVFAAAQLCLGLLSFPLFRKEDSSAGDRSITAGTSSS
jgi:predicted MFS family arabinose efflux permease